MTTQSSNHASLNDLPYTSLAPIGTADNDGSYSEALNWALTGPENRRISNIALTGPYGSGKSSIIKTFLNSESAKSLKPLFVSLANFKEENGSNTKSSEGESFQKQIEISILQQIFYHENHENIPDSRLKRINTISTRKQVALWAYISLFIISTGWIIGENDICSYFGVQLLGPAARALRYLAGSLFASAVFALTFTSIRRISQISLSKLKIQDTEFDIGSGASRSILNEHIDEILYFFEATQFDVVIIEDLDRFEQTEVFTKLREINMLINNAKSVKRNIRFIYCVRDELFYNKDRTKFFDFIIPVIPVINPSNSKDVLIQKTNSLGHNINRRTIEDLSLFIDEMRLLHNILNEFNIYKKKLSSNLSQDKLLAFICYKNIHPNDFSLLPKDEGVLYGYFERKRATLAAATSEINANIIELDASLKKAESDRILRLEDLRKIYSYHVIVHAMNQNPYNQATIFVVNNAQISLGEISNEQHFEAIARDNYLLRIANQGNVPPNTRFKQIEAMVDKTASYSDKKNAAEKAFSVDQESLKEQIRLNRAKIEKFRTASIRDLLEEGFKFFSEAGRQHKFIELLLREGYIEEDYQSYISIFHEGSISKGDHDFLIDVKTRVSSNPNRELSNIPNIIDRLSLKDFHSSAILNHDIVDYLVHSRPDTEYMKAIFKQIAIERSNPNDYLDSYFQRGKNLDVFLPIFARHEPRLWHYIDAVSNLTSEIKDQFFSIMIKGCETSVIQEQAKHSDLKRFFEASSNLMLFGTNVEKFTENLAALDIKFIDISFLRENVAFLAAVSQYQSFTLTPNNIEVLYNYYTNPETDIFRRRNFEAISDPRFSQTCELLISSIDTYVEEIYIQIPENRNETEEYLAKLFAIPDISIQSQISIAAYIATIVQNPEAISDKSVLEILARHKKLAFSWKSIIVCFQMCSEDLEEWIVNFVNTSISDNSLLLGKLSDLDYDEDTINKLLAAIIANSSLAPEAYRHMIGLLGYTYSAYSGDLSEDRVMVLIEHGVLQFTRDNIDFVFKNHSKLFAKFAKKHSLKILETEGGVILSPEEYLNLFNSDAFDLTVLIPILAKDEYVEFESEESVISALSKSVRSTAHVIPNRFRAQIVAHLKNNLSEFIFAFSLWCKSFNEEMVTSLINGLPLPYSSISDRSYRVLIPNTPESLDFVISLKEIKYISNYMLVKDGIRVSPAKMQNKN